ncbi:hypothetical protein Y032_0141g2248 [Ancylostoma ceylanicum]|uniref:Uncharacterized protein n=1 Tax=Ancylostoma ceylanicum TaxID=53326 RepID=A0A016T3Z1_9BILA|nr:hypothetical protein Y032_0141g2248 [Ancylostoma ceylanicum]
MNLLSELYEKLKRKLTIEQRKPSGSQSSVSKTSRSQSVRETSMRPKVSAAGTVVVRPRAGTEIVIERRRCSKSLSIMDNNPRTTAHKVTPAHLSSIDYLGKPPLAEALTTSHAHR